MFTIRCKAKIDTSPKNTIFMQIPNTIKKKITKYIDKQSIYQYIMFALLLLQKDLIH